MQYQVIEAESLGELIREVNDWLRHGWVPVGGV